MKDENLELNVPEEIIVLIEYTHTGRKPPRGKRYKVQVDDKQLIFNHEVVTGEEILKAAGLEPIECYSLYLKLKGCDFELIRPHEEIDLIKRGPVEHFISKPPVVFHYSVDNEPETTEESELSANQILELAGIAPVKDYYLVRVNKDGSQVSYKDTPDTPIQMECPPVKYVSIFRGEVPVS